MEAMDNKTSQLCKSSILPISLRQDNNRILQPMPQLKVAKIQVLK